MMVVTEVAGGGESTEVDGIEPMNLAEVENEP